MKPDIHPKYYEAKVHCGSCGTEWTVGSTRPELRVDVCSNCHPFFTGKQNIIDTAGQVERFQKRLERQARTLDAPTGLTGRPSVPAGRIAGRPLPDRCPSTHTAARPSWRACSCAAATRSRSPCATRTAGSSPPPSASTTASTHRRSRSGRSSAASWCCTRRSIIGTRWLIRSANVQAEEDDVELGKGSIIVMLLVTFAVAIAAFTLLPLFVSSVATSGSIHGWAQPALEGLIQVGLFLGYLTLVSRAPDIHRVFQYHGAEHMTIHALEAGDPLTVDEVRKYPTAHHRCGTEFLVILVLLSIFTFSLVGKQEPLVMIVSRILLIPVIAAVGYEILRFGATHRHNPLIRVIMYRGILVQMITTKRPTDDMIEVAIASMQEALVADGNEVPAGSTDFEREPMRLDSARTRPDRRSTGRRTDRERPTRSAAASPGEPPPLA